MLKFPKNSSSDVTYPDGQLPLMKRAAVGVAVIFTDAMEEILNVKTVTISWFELNKHQWTTD